LKKKLILESAFNVPSVIDSPSTKATFQPLSKGITKAHPISVIISFSETFLTSERESLIFNFSGVTKDLSSVEI